MKQFFFACAFFCSSFWREVAAGKHP